MKKPIHLIEEPNWTPSNALNPEERSHPAMVAVAIGELMLSLQRLHPDWSESQIANGIIASLDAIKNHIESITEPTQKTPD